MLSLVAGLLLLSPPGVSQTQLGQARTLVAGGKWADAERILIRITTAEPTNFRAHLLLGEARYKQGKLALAADNLTLARTLRPDSAPAAQLLGYVRFAQQDYVQAVHLLKSAVDAGSDDAATCYRLGLAFERSGQVSSARDSLRQAALRHNGDVPIIAALARLERRLGRHSEATYWYRRAVALRPHDRDLFREMMASYMAGSDYLGAQVALQSYLDDNPSDVQAWRMLAETYEKLSLPLQARTVYLKIDQMGMLTDRERCGLLDSYLRESLWAEAVAQYEKLQTVTDAALHAAAGQAYANLQMWDRAIAALQKALAAGKTTERQRLLADVYYSAGEYARAHELYGDLLATQTDDQLLTMAAAAALRSGHGQAGLDLLKRLVASRPDDYPLRQLAAETAEQVGQLDEALGQWFIAAQLSEAEADAASLAIARIAANAGYREWALRLLADLDYQSLSAHDLADVARLGYSLGDSATAYQAAELLLANADASPEMQAVAAQILMASGEVNRLQALDGAWKRSADSAHLSLAYARGLIRGSEYARAVEVCRKALAHNPQQVDLYAILIRACELWQRPTVAVGVISQLIADGHLNTVSVDFLRQAHEQADGTEAAVEAMRTLLDRYPEDPSALAATARALERAGNPAEAADFYQRLIPHYGRSAAHDAAYCHAKAGASDLARQLVASHLPPATGLEQIASMLENLPIEMAVDLLSVAPDSIEFHLKLAQLYASSNTIQDGLTFFATASEDSSMSGTRVGMAYLLVHSGQYTAGLAELDRLSEEDKSNSRVRLLLSECHLGAGNLTTAIQTAQSVLMLSDDAQVCIRAAEIVAEAAMQAGDGILALEALLQILAVAPENNKSSELLRALCREELITATELQQGLSRTYRVVDDPTSVLSLAGDLGKMPGYEGLREWVDNRQSAAGRD